MLKMLGYDITEEEYSLLLHKYAWALGRGINKADLLETIPRLKNRILRNIVVKRTKGRGYTGRSYKKSTTNGKFMIGFGEGGDF